MNKDILQDDVISQDILQPFDNLPNRDVLRDTQTTGAIVRSSLPRTQRVRTDTGFAIYKLKGNRYVFDYEVINLPFGQIQRKANGEKEVDIDPTSLVNFLQSKGYTVSRNGNKITITIRDEVYEIDLNRLSDSDVEFLKTIGFPENKIEKALDIAFNEYGLDFFFRGGKLFAKNSFQEEREYLITPRGIRVKEGHELPTSFGSIHISPITLSSPDQITTVVNNNVVYDKEKLKNLVKSDPVLKTLVEKGHVSIVFKNMTREDFNRYSSSLGINLSRAEYKKVQDMLRNNNTPDDKPAIIIRTETTGAVFTAYVFNPTLNRYVHQVLYDTQNPEPQVDVPITSLYNLVVFAGGTDSLLKSDNTYNYYQFYYGDSPLPMLIRVNKQTGERSVVPSSDFTTQEYQQAEEIIRKVKNFLGKFNWSRNTAEYAFWYPWMGNNANIVPLGKDGSFFYVGSPDGSFVYRISRNANPDGSFSITRMGYNFIDSTLGMQPHETTFINNLVAPYTTPITNYVHEEYIPHFLRNSKYVSRENTNTFIVWDPDDQNIYRLNTYTRTATKIGSRSYDYYFGGSYQRTYTMQTMDYILWRTLGSTTDVLEAIKERKPYSQPQPLTKLLSAAYGYSDITIDLNTLRDIARSAYNLSTAAGAEVYVGDKRITNADEINSLDKRSLLSLRYKKQLNTGGVIEDSVYSLLTPSTVQNISSLAQAHLRAFIQDNQGRLETIENLQNQLQEYTQSYTNSVRPDERTYFLDKINKTTKELQEIIAGLKIQQNAPRDLKDYVKLVTSSVDSYLANVKSYLKKIDEIYEDAQKNKTGKDYGELNPVFELYNNYFNQLRLRDETLRRADEFRILSTELDLTAAKLTSFLEQELKTGVSVASRVGDKIVDKTVLGERIKELSTRISNLAGDLRIKTPDMLDVLSKAFILGEFATKSYRSNDILDELNYYKELYKKYEDPFMKELIESKMGALVYPVINNKDVAAIEKILNLKLPDNIQNLLKKTLDTINDERLLNSLEGRLSSFLKNKTVGDLLKDSFVKEYKTVFNSVRDKLKTEEAKALLSSMENEFDFKIAVARDYVNRNKELNVEFTEIKNEPLAPIFRIVDLGLTTSLLGGIGGSVIPVIGTKIGTVVGGLIGVGAGLTYETLTGWQTTSKTKTTEKIQTINLNEPLLLDSNSQKTFNTLFGLVPPTETKDPFYTGLKNIKKQESVAKPMTPAVPEVVNLFIGDLVSKGTNPYDIYYDPKTGVVKVKKS